MQRLNTVDTGYHVQKNRFALAAPGGCALKTKSSVSAVGVASLFQFLS